MIYKEQDNVKINQLQVSHISGKIRRDISILTRSAYTNFDNDAASCYGRIFMLVSSLSGRKYGLHKQVMYVHAATLKEAEYKLKLSSKISSASY